MIPTQSRSTLKDHRIPAFYACYLLKSIRTAQSRATYIGSTPNPPRRIRQHNGEITQGAWKTKQHRPWVMQMIVHGFPSRSAALQFEWAWQHPHRSRHLRNEDGKAVFSRTRKGNPLKTNIRIVRNMVSSHPYNMWSLHVKLFTEEALEAWKGADHSSDATPLPVGFTSSVELEGVDGKGGETGAGRNGPIDVTDETFTLSQLAKASKLSRAKQSLQCSICHEPIVDFKSEPLKYAVCVTTHCTAVSHLRCLSEDFLGNSSPHTAIIPRGGDCRSCGSHVLWGDIIRGCYRRRQGSVIAASEVDAEEDEEPGTDEVDAMEPQSSQRQKRGTKAKAVKRSSRKTEDGEHEIFDLNAISSCDESEPHVPLKASTSKTRSRAPKSSAKESVGTPTKRTRKPAGTTKLTKRVSKKVSEGKSRFHTQATQPGDSSVEEFFDLNAISTDDEYDGAPPAPSPLKICSVDRAKGKRPESITISPDRPLRRNPDICEPEYTTRHAASMSSRRLALNPRSAMQLGEVDFFEIDHESDVPGRRMLQSSVNNLTCRGCSELEYSMSGLSISSPCASSNESSI